MSLMDGRTRAQKISHNRRVMKGLTSKIFLTLLGGDRHAHLRAKSVGRLPQRELRLALFPHGYPEQNGSFTSSTTFFGNFHPENLDRKSTRLNSSHVPE